MFGWLLPIYLSDLTWPHKVIRFRFQTVMRLAEVQKVHTRICMLLPSIFTGWRRTAN